MPAGLIAITWFSGTEDWLGRWAFQRALALIYLVAFLAAANQFRALVGERGMTPIPRYVERVPFRRSPSLFQWRYSDRLFAGVAWTGVAVSAALVVGVHDHLPLLACMALWLVPWALYLSIVNVGQTWWSFGWETLLLEAGFLAVFLGPGDVAAPIPVLWLVRWLLFRVEFGAGLIKLRGDPCWRDLTCLRYHHETQPLPGPFSWWFHHLPMPLHKVEVAANHVTQLVVPVLLFVPQPVAGIAAAVVVITQSWLVISGNFSWLNALTMALAIPILGDGLLGVALPFDAPAPVDASPTWHRVVVVALVVVVAWLSRRPISNLVSSRQAMNASFDPLHLVNTYGAFGSITRRRREIVIEGTSDLEVGPDTEWLAYGFKAKPGDPHRRPPQVAPYHLRLDWLMWFAALSPSYGDRWFEPLLQRLLRNDPDTLRLLRTNPFPDAPPTWVRARLYDYRFTTREERKATGAWWHCTPVADYHRPIRRR